jgi:hypothetical protein
MELCWSGLLSAPSPYPTPTRGRCSTWLSFILPSTQFFAILSPTANFLLESTIERLHYKLEYADRDIGKLAVVQICCRMLTCRYLTDKRRERRSSRRDRESFPFPHSLIFGICWCAGSTKRGWITITPNLVRRDRTKTQRRDGKLIFHSWCSELTSRNEKSEISSSKSAH